MTTPDPNDPRQYGSPYSDPTVPSAPSDAPPPWQPQPDQPAGYPPPGYGPTGFGSSGYTQPGYAQPGYPPYGYPPGAYGGYSPYESDPLVPAPGGGVSAWWNQCWRAFARSWQQLLVIVLVTSTLPAFAFTAIGLSAVAGQSVYTRVQNPDASETITLHWHPVLVFALVAILFVIVAVFLTSAGWAAAIWTVTRQAAGLPAPLGAAFAYGFRRCAQIAGVLIVVALMVFAGLVACFIPGLYLAVASSLVVPFLIFDRGSGAIGNSFRTVNANFGAVLGRLLLAFLLTSAAGLASTAITLPFGSTEVNADGTINAGSGVVSSLVSSVVSIPATMFLIIAVLMTYVQMRARAIPTTAGDLAAALDR